MEGFEKKILTAFNDDFEAKNDPDSIPDKR